jgi:hypothetical protein
VGLKANNLTLEMLQNTTMDAGWIIRETKEKLCVATWNVLNLLRTGALKPTGETKVGRPE